MLLCCCLVQPPGPCRGLPATITISWTGDASFDIDCPDCDEREGWPDDPFCRWTGSFSLTSASVGATLDVLSCFYVEDGLLHDGTFTLTPSECNGADKGFCGDPIVFDVEMRIIGWAPLTLPGDSEPHWYMTLEMQTAAFDPFGGFPNFSTNPRSVCCYELQVLAIRFRGPPATSTDPRGTYTPAGTIFNPSNDWYVSPTVDSDPTCYQPITYPNSAGSVVVS
jgi:hypothetical protein